MWDCFDAKDTHPPVTQKWPVSFTWHRKWILPLSFIQISVLHFRYWFSNVKDMQDINYGPNLKLKTRYNLTLLFVPGKLALQTYTWTLWYIAGLDICFEPPSEFGKWLYQGCLIHEVWAWKNAKYNTTHFLTFLSSSTLRNRLSTNLSNPAIAANVGSMWRGFKSPFNL